MGYRFAFSFLENKSVTQLNIAIDEENYNQQNLIEIKIPLNMPYFSDKEYEVAYGETEINGMHYQYVKKKVSNNILYLMCLPNNEKTILVAAKNNIEKNILEATNNKSNQKNPVHLIIKSLQQEYLNSNVDYQISNEAIAKITLPKIHNSKSGDLFVALTPTQPPEFCI